MILKKYFLILVCALSGQAYAGSGWTNFGKVDEINHQQLGGAGSDLIFITAELGNNQTDPLECTVRNGFYFQVTDDRTERIFTILLSALISGREVRLFLSGECHTWGRAKLDGVIIK